MITAYGEDLHTSLYYISLVLLGNQQLTKAMLPVNLYKRKKIGGRKGQWRINIFSSRFPSHDRYLDILHYAQRRRRKRRRSRCYRYNISLRSETNSRGGQFYYHFERVKCEQVLLRSFTLVGSTTVVFFANFSHGRYEQFTRSTTAS